MKFTRKTIKEYVYRNLHSLWKVSFTFLKSGAPKAPELTELDLSYAPPYSSAKGPVNMAGFMIEDLERGKVRQFHWDAVEDLPCDGSAALLDVRTEGEYRRGGPKIAIDIPGFQVYNDSNFIEKR